MKILYSVLMVFFLSTIGVAQSEEVLPDRKASCSVEVITDICGSGIVNLDFESDSFTLDYGDVHCWFGDFQLKGSLKNPRRAHTGTATTVDLVIDSTEGGNVIGQFTYRSKNQEKSALATLNLEAPKVFGEQHGRNGGIYHLSCRDKK